MTDDQDRWAEFLSRGGMAAAADLGMNTAGGLKTGTRIGAYEIVSLLGSGGMGEVYRARDTRLGREVAIKVLSPAFTADADRLARFEREARVLATLNHPHIGAIYGVEDSDGGRALVLELVEGPTLADRLARGPMPVAEALPLARQMTDALDAAHEKGIVHRDLKPTNIKITPDGVVKVLDFGLAKLNVSHRDAAGTQSPTVTVGDTREGLIVGTAAYMSPEQARGQAVDKRTDIWAFGCVLYEMLTGRVAFPGNTISDTIAAILEREPDWTSLPSATPHAIDRLLHHCVEKDPRRRLRDIADAQSELADNAWGTQSKISEVAASRSLGRLRTVGVAIALLALGLGLMLGWMARPRPPALQPNAVRINVSPPAGTTFLIGSATISPDGHLLAFVAQSSGAARLWVRALDSEEAHELPGTDGARLPFWSPDGRYLGFFGPGRLERIDVSGGLPTTICEVPAGAGAAWSPSGVIILNAVNDGPLLQVSASGGLPTPLTMIDSKHENSHRFPTFLPDGRTFLFFVRTPNLGDAAQGIYLGSLDRPGEKTQIVRTGRAGIYAPGPDPRRGHLLWARNGAVVAQPFDVERLKLSGEPEAVAALQEVGLGSALSPLSVSRDGTLVYGTPPDPRSQVTLYARDGKPVKAVGPFDAYVEATISPDGREVALARPNLQTQPLGEDIWLMDLERGIPNRATFGGASSLGLGWSADSRRFAYVDAGGPPNLWVQNADGHSGAQRLTESPDTQQSPDLSPDGRFLLYANNRNDPSSTTRADLLLLSLEGSRTIAPYLQTPFSEIDGRFSPDGKWVAYTSDESGRSEIYVQSFPVGAGKWRMSTAGGTRARWRRDGKELFYLAPDNMLMAVPVHTAAASLKISTPTRLFRVPGRPGVYDVAPDGQRILALPGASENAAPSTTIVVNWPALLKH